jgi:DHA2 family multidrug resistance protein
MLLCLGIGSLQIVLDKGQQDDWFNSQFIVGLSCVAAVCLVSLVVWELRQKSPVLDLRIFKDRSFASGNAIMFLGFFAFFGSIVLLPLYLQTLMGYTSFLAGLVLGPGGALSILMLPMVGRLTERFDSRKLLGLGLVVMAYSVYYMAGFNLDIDFGTAVMGRLLQGIGMPFFFVTSAYVTMAYVSNQQMNNASAIFNLLRNLGGSFGVAFVTTVLARRAQFHQNRLIEHLTVFNPGFTFRLEELKAALAAKLGTMSDHTQLALGIIYRFLQREAAAMAFNDAFLIQTFIFLGLIGILFLIRKPPIGKHPSSSEGGLSHSS